MVVKIALSCVNRALKHKQVRKLCTSRVYSKQESVQYETQWSYVCGPGSPPLLGMTIGQAVDRGEDLFGDRDGLVDVAQNKRRNFSQLREEIKSLAAGLLQLGLKPGDRIGLWGQNSLEWYITQFAAAKAGLVLVNINPAYQAAELKYCLNKVEVSAIVCNESFKTQDYYQLLLTVAPELASAVAGDLRSSQVPHLKHIIIISDKEKSGCFKFSDILSNAGSSARNQVDELTYKIQMDSPANIQFTSGTTGNPKGVTLSHHNLVNNGYHIGHRLGYDRTAHRICVSVPLYHCFGNVAGTIWEHDIHT